MLCNVLYWMVISSYSRVPRPSLTPCSRQLSQLVSGWVSVKWSWWQRSVRPKWSRARWAGRSPRRRRPGPGRWGQRRRTCPRRAQWAGRFRCGSRSRGRTSTTRLMWKLGLSLMTAQVYSAILQLRMSLASSLAACTASTGQRPMHRPQPTPLGVVDGGLPVCDGDGAVGAVLLAGAAAHALFLDHVGLAGAVHLHLACPGAAPHADVLQAAPEAGGLVAFKVGQAD